MTFKIQMLLIIGFNILKFLSIYYLISFRAHLERIYNQSINKANVSPNKELLMLQQENPSIDEKTKLQLQAQHQNLIHNLQHVDLL
jgi:hypothetical protein